MGHENLQSLIGTAVVDAEFRHHLLEDASTVIGGFDLSPEEREAILAIKATDLQSFAGQLHHWITRSHPVMA